MRRLALLILAALFLSAVPVAAQTAHLWVDTNGGTCTRQGTPAAYVDAAACSSFAAAYSAATTGDDARVKNGTYGPQSCGDASKAVTITGESSSVIIDSGTNHNSGLSFSGNCTVDTVGVAGDYPFVFFGGANNTWRNSRFYEGREERRCDANDAEPILIYSDSGTAVSNTTLQNLYIEDQRGSPDGEGGCSGDNYHLEQIRIDQNVDGVLIDRVEMEACPSGAGFVGCETANIFITSPGSPDPRNITIRNTIVHGGPKPAINVHGNVSLSGSTFAYNTTGNLLVAFDATPTSVSLIGNLGAKPHRSVCLGGTTYTKNVWQHETGAVCGTDTQVVGANEQTDQLGWDANLRLLAGSDAIDGAEDTCASTANGEDIAGDSRPAGSACDAGADEFGAEGGGGDPPVYRLRFRAAIEQASILALAIMLAWRRRRTV